MQILDLEFKTVLYHTTTNLENKMIHPNIDISNKLPIRFLDIIMMD
jgi:hypothetical protein